MRNSDCPTGLVCRDQRCQVECASDRDCPSGQLCSRSDGGSATCREPDRSTCVRNTDCRPPFVCGSDQQCRLECGVPRSFDTQGRPILPTLPGANETENVAYWQSIADRDCPPERFCVLGNPIECNLEGDEATLDRCDFTGTADVVLSSVSIERSRVLNRCWPRPRPDAGIAPPPPPPDAGVPDVVFIPDVPLPPIDAGMDASASMDSAVAPPDTFVADVQVVPDVPPPPPDVPRPPDVFMPPDVAMGPVDCFPPFGPEQAPLLIAQFEGIPGDEGFMVGMGNIWTPAMVAPNAPGSWLTTVGAACANYISEFATGTCNGPMLQRSGIAWGRAAISGVCLNQYTIQFDGTINTPTSSGRGSILFSLVRDFGPGSPPTFTRTGSAPSYGSSYSNYDKVMSVELQTAGSPGYVELRHSADGSPGMTRTVAPRFTTAIPSNTYRVTAQFCGGSGTRLHIENLTTSTIEVDRYHDPAPVPPITAAVTDLFATVEMTGAHGIDNVIVLRGCPPLPLAPLP